MQPNTTAQDSSAADSGRTWRFFWLMLFAVALPMLVSHLTNLWSRDAYRYFPFVLLAVGWLAYTRWDREFRAPTGWVGWTAIILGLLLSFVAVLTPSPWLASLSFLSFCFAFCSASHDQEGLSLVGIGLPLIMLVNLPLGLDQLLVIRLQQITTSLSSVALDLLAVPHAIENNVIRLSTRDLFVAEACSGIQSVFTLMFISILMVAINRRLLWLTPIYLAIAIVLAIFANVFRVTTVAVGDVWFGVDLAEGWQHELIGYLALMLGCLFLLSFDQLLLGLLHPVHESPGHSEELNPVIRAWNFLVGEHSVDDRNVAPIVWLFTHTSARGDGIWRRIWPGRLLIVVSSVLLLASISQAIHTFRPINAFGKSTELVFVPRASALDGISSLTVNEHQIVRDGADPRLGDNADIWNCRLNDLDLDAQFIVSQPYTGWHELCWCYTAQNWTLLSRIIRDQPPNEEAVDGLTEDHDQSNSRPYALAKFRVNNAGFAYLFYSAIDRSGNPADPPYQTGRLQGRFAHYLQGENIAMSDIAMMQLLIVNDRRLDPSEIERLSSHFVNIRQAILADARGVRKDERETVSIETQSSIADGAVQQGKGVPR